MVSINTSHGATVLLVRHSSICRPVPARSATVHLITVAPLNKHIHVTLTLCDTLRWLPVAQCIKYKTALMTFSCIHGTSSAYYHGMCCLVASVEGRAMLRSSNYIEPRTEGKCCGPHSFNAALFGKIC